MTTLPLAWVMPQPTRYQQHQLRDRSAVSLRHQLERLPPPAAVSIELDSCCTRSSLSSTSLLLQFSRYRSSAPPAHPAPFVVVGVVATGPGHSTAPEELPRLYHVNADAAVRCLMRSAHDLPAWCSSSLLGVWPAPLIPGAAWSSSPQAAAASPLSASGPKTSCVISFIGSLIDLLASLVGWR
uniref:Uncharacterized protein n=1 Tax=Kalanchoe fedtschenkoi TaxID=63787 RepID=A0A7N0URS1_KALFE